MKTMNMRTMRAAVAGMLVAVLLALPGCGLFGAPTAKEIADANQAAEKAAEQVDLLKQQQAEAERAALEAAAIKAAAESAALKAQATMQSLGAAIAGAQPEDLPVYQAAFAAASTRLEAAQATGERAAIAAAAAQRAVASVQAAAAKGDADLDRVVAQIDALTARRAAAASATGAAIRQAGAAAQQAGVPGAGVIGESVAGLATSLTGMLLPAVGGSGIAYALARRKGKTEVARVAEARDALAEVIQATESFGLLAQAPAALKKAAKDQLSAEARRQLALVTADVDKGSAVPPPQPLAIAAA